MYVHEGAGLCYLANPRTASRATARALLGIGFVMVGSHHADRTGERPWLDGLLTFTTVRDLGDTISSWGRKYADAEPGRWWDEEAILDRLGSGNQRGIIEGWESWTLFPHARRADVLLHYEHLQEELNALLARHGLGPVTLERVP